MAVDELGRQLAIKTVAGDHGRSFGVVGLGARASGRERYWAVEDCRHVPRRLERDLLGAGERIVRVPPKLMAAARSSARTYGKSDPIDTLAVARAALREPGCPPLGSTGPNGRCGCSWITEKTWSASVLESCPVRWHLHELDPSWESAPRSLDRAKTWATIEARLAGMEGLVARLARNLVQRCRQLTVEINELHTEITARVTPLAPTLLAICGCGPLTTAKIVAETAGVDRFRSAAAYARHTGTAPLPVWSSNQPRHRLSRTGNRQLNAALYRIALTQARCHPGARALLDRRRAQGDSTREAFRVLRRRLSDVVYRAILTDQRQALCPAA